MNEEQKKQIKNTVGGIADELSDKALTAAKEQTNKLWKILLYCVGIMLAGIAALAGVTGCNSVPSAPHVTLTVEQVQAAETIYTALGGEVKYRVIPVVEYKK